MVDSADGDRMSQELTERRLTAEQQCIIEETKRFIYPSNGYRVGWRLDGVGAWAWCNVIHGRKGETQCVEFVSSCTKDEVARLNGSLNARIVMRYAPDRQGEPWALASIN